MKRSPRRRLVLGDLNLGAAHLRRLASVVDEVIVCRSTDPRIVRSRLRSARYVFACNFDLTPYIGDLADTDLVVLAETGIVNIDPELARKAGVRFANIPGYSTDAVAQYVLRCVLESLRPWERIFASGKTLQRARAIGAGIESKRVGLVGFGHVGQKLAALFSAFGCRISASTRQMFYHEMVKWTPLEALFADSDALVVCCDWNQSSRGMIGRDLLNLLPKGALLVSIAHRDVFVASELAETLQHRTDITAWLDFDPRAGDENLRNCPNVHLSPHLAFFTRETIRNRRDRCIDQLEAFLNSADVALVY
jgi:phosphoglycerate dehydrogenase-like enzyme